jgi:hypothetical protein
VACGSGILAVAMATWVYFPRTKPWRKRFSTTPPQPASLYFFKTVSKIENDAFLHEVRRISGPELAVHQTNQVWQLAKVAQWKTRRLKWGFLFIACFLIAWGASRIFLGVAGG